MQMEVLMIAPARPRRRHRRRLSLNLEAIFSDLPLSSSHVQSTGASETSNITRRGYMTTITAVELNEHL